jgi:hypothetical protein
VLAHFADRSLGVILAVFGLIALLPIIGGIPGVSITVAIVVVLAVLRTVLGGGGIRLPGQLGDRAIERERLTRAVEKARPWTDRIDRLLKPRLVVLVGDPVSRLLVAVSALFLAVTMIPLAFVPFGVTPASAGITAFGLGLIARDGVLAGLGYLMVLANFGVIFGLV